MSSTILRAFIPEDENAFLKLQAETFKGLEYPPRLKPDLSALDRDGSLVAERDGSIVGCVGLFKLERPSWFEIRNLAVRDIKPEQVGEKLLAKVTDHADSKHSLYLKASTPAVQPYVDLYKRAGFKPVRRSVRICWDLANVQMNPGKVQTKELSKESANDAADVWVEGLRPYWDYWIHEEGGPFELKAWVRDSVGKTPGWIGSFS